MEPSDLGLSKDEAALLARIAHCQQSDLAARVAGLARAATEEYVRMALGQRVFTRGQDVREYRLYLLIQHYFGGRLPTEQQISDHFQTTATQSRALLRAVMSKYQYELQDAIDQSLRNALDGAVKNDASWIMTVDSENIVEALNRRLASIAGQLPQIARRPNTIATYQIQASTYQELKKDLGPKT